MSRPPASALCLTLATALLLAGCAAAVPGYTPNVKAQERQAKLAEEARNAGRMTATGTYELGPDEQALDCKKLTGRMQIKILQIRDHNERNVGSGLSRSIQSVTTPVFGGTSYAIDPAADAARDRAMLEAYNRQLAAKNCKTFDLASELQPKAVRDTPTPVAKPK